MELSKHSLNTKSICYYKNWLDVVKITQTVFDSHVSTNFRYKAHIGMDIGLEYTLRTTAANVHVI